MTALKYAVTSDCTDIVTSLLDAGADPNVHTEDDRTMFQTALELAVDIENIEMIKLLLDKGKQKSQDPQVFSCSTVQLKIFTLLCTSLHYL